jgi:hypothetical protein
MTLLLPALVMAALVAGMSVAFVYSRSQHGFFTLREVRRRIWRGVYACRRWQAGSARHGTGSPL